MSTAAGAALMNRAGSLPLLLVPVPEGKTGAVDIISRAVRMADSWRAALAGIRFRGLGLFGLEPKLLDGCPETQPLNHHVDCCLI